MSAPAYDRAAGAEDTRTDWETPAHIFGPLHEEFGFDLDAAADVDTAKVTAFLTGPHRETDDGSCDCGLCTLWCDRGDAIWLNPPYGRGLDQWIRKCIAESQAGNCTVVALLPDSLDTKWFRSVFNTAWEIRIVEGRIQFEGTTSSNPCGSVIAVWRPGIRPYGQPVFSLRRQQLVARSVVFGSVTLAPGNSPTRGQQRRQDGCGSGSPTSE